MSLDTLLAAIKQCDEDVKSAHGFMLEATEMHSLAVAALANAQEAFDRAVCEARGVAYVPGTPAHIPAPVAPNASPPASGATTEFAPPLPPPVPVGPRVLIPGSDHRPAHMRDDDDRPDGIG